MTILERLFGASKKQTTLDTVRQAAKASLSTFVSERLVRFPDKQRLFETGKTHLIIGHHCAEFALRQVIENPAGVFSPLLAAIHQSPFRNMQRFFVTVQLAIMYRDVVENPGNTKSWMYLLSEGACDMYSQPYSVFTNTHTQYLAKNKAAGSGDYPQLMARAMNCCMDGLYSDLGCGNQNVIGTMSIMMATFKVMDSLTADKRMATGFADLMLKKDWRT